MILYRARTIASRACRHPTFEGNGPDIRVKGRWFTSDIHAAIAHRASLAGPAEIIAVEIDDRIVESFQVATTPHTQCGLSPIEHSIDPQADYVIPMFWVMDHIEVEIEGNARRRDVIDVNAPVRPAVRTIRIDLTPKALDLPLAA